jgi:septum formation inhibitor MinC
MKHALTILGVAFLASTWTNALPQDQTANSSSQSLADAARKARAERARESRKPVKVFTNDTLPTAGGISVIGPPASEEPSGATGADQVRAKLKQEARDQWRNLSSNLELHQRELAVLQQKLNLAQIQFSFNPNETLQQETFRTNINNLTQEVEEKNRQVADDQQAIADLQDQVQREGGDASWLTAPGGTGSTGSPSERALAEKLPKAGTREYWQRRFQIARDSLARAQEEQQLAENELSLLQTRQAQELNPASQTDLAQAIPAKQEETRTKRAAVEKAKQDLDTLEKEFGASGAPAEWSQPEPAAAPPQ